jgi:hypothetical protein
MPAPALAARAVACVKLETRSMVAKALLGIQIVDNDFCNDLTRESSYSYYGCSLFIAKIYN